MTDHPITLPPELIKDWHDEWNESDQIVHSAYTHIAIRAAQWGSDQELEACCELLDNLGGDGEMIRRYRRPKPPSLKKQALRAAHIEVDPQGKNGSLIIRALEALPDD